MDDTKKRNVIIAAVAVAVVLAIGSAYMTFSGEQGHGTPGPKAPPGFKNEKQLAMEAQKTGGQPAPETDKQQRGDAAGNPGG